MELARTINSMKEMQETNRTTVLRVLFASDAPLTRGEIAKRTGLSAATITRIIKDLLQENLVIEVGKEELLQGRNRELLQINYDQNHVLGFEVNESFVHGALCDLKGSVKLSSSRVVQAKEPGAIAHSLKEIMEEMAAQQAFEPKVIGIGLSISGVVEPSKRRVVHSNTMGWQDVQVNDLFPELGELRVVVENDANAALLGEVWLASVHDDHNVAYIVIGEGAIGASLLVDGRLARGSTFMAGEISHFPVQPNGKLCACGNAGCFETYVSLERLEQEFWGLGGAGKLLEAFQAGDDLARKFVVEAAQKVALVICSLTYLVNPGKVILGGPWIEAGPEFLELIRREVQEDFALGERHIPQIVYSKLHPHAGVMGAVGLVINEFLEY